MNLADVRKITELIAEIDLKLKETTSNQIEILRVVKDNLVDFERVEKEYVKQNCPKCNKNNEVGVFKIEKIADNYYKFMYCEACDDIFTVKLPKR